MKPDKELRDLMSTFIFTDNDEKNWRFWQKLNEAEQQVYVRFQRMFAHKNGGKWIRGWNVLTKTFNIE